jgi:hypothetical protein
LLGLYWERLLLWLYPPANAQELSDINVSGGIGLFKPTEKDLREAMEEIYGLALLRFRLGAAYTPKKIDQMLRGRVEGGVDVIYATKKGQPLEYTEGDVDVESSSRFSILTIRPKIAYYFNEKGKFSPYIGVTFPWVSVTEKAEATGYYDGDVESVNAKANLRGMGIGGMVGIDAPISEHLSVYLEGSLNKVNTKLKSMEVNGESWDVTAEEKVNVGGFSLDVGLKYNF